MQIDGRYLGRNDQHFITNVSRDLEAYLTSSNDRNRVLLFPPLTSRHRFLIHKLTEENKESKLVSFSIGENEKRRTVVCFEDTLNWKQSLRKPNMDDESNDSSRETSLMSSTFDETITSRAKNRRPDKQLYVPKAKRSDEPVATQTSVNTPVVITSSTAKLVPDSKIKQNLTDKLLLNGETKTNKKKKKKKVVVSDAGTNENRSETVFELVRGENLEPTCVLDKDYLSHMLQTDLKVNSCDEYQSDHRNLWSKVEIQGVEAVDVKENKESISTEEVFVKEEVNENKDFVAEHPNEENCIGGQVNPAFVVKSILSQTRRKSSSGESWDALYDQSGECLDSSLLDQLTEKVGKVTIETPQIDYWSSPESEATSSLIDEELGHVVEIYDFPVVFKTQDLITAFSQFKDRGFDIKWVDDTHALGVFSSRVAAREALSLKHPFIKTRPLSQGIKESKRKAQRSSEFLQPYKIRPETSALLARRLVAGALGLQVQVSKEQREEERRKLKEAKERKRLVVKQKEDAWNGDVHD